MISFACIRRMAEDFPGMEESTSYRTPAMKVGGKLVLRMHQEEDAIVVMLRSREDRDDLLSDDPGNFFITDHYRDSSAVLVRPSVEEPVFRVVLESAWRRVARKKDLSEFERNRQERGDSLG